MPEANPAVSEMPQRIDVRRISAVRSNVRPAAAPLPAHPADVRQDEANEIRAKEAVNNINGQGRDGGGNIGNGNASGGGGTITQLTIHGGGDSSSSSNNTRAGRPSVSAAMTDNAFTAEKPEEGEEEAILLELQTASPSVASAWLDGLLMLLDQQPITAETHRLIDAMEGWGMKVRLLGLGLGMEDVEWEDDSRKSERMEKGRVNRDGDRLTGKDLSLIHI